MQKKCLECGKIFYKPISRSIADWNKRAKYCSRECKCLAMKEFFKDRKIIWGRKISKAKMGHLVSKKTREKIGLSCIGKKHTKEWKKQIGLSVLGDKNSNWKGEKVGYDALHAWINRKLGKPNTCEHCGIKRTGRQIHWASIDHTYKRNLEDWIRLCSSCHKKYDIKNNLIKGLLKL